MKKIVIIGLLSVAMCHTEAQQLISSEAFNRLVKRDITYAILGDNSPSQGAKLDLTAPKLNINALLPSQKGIWTLEFEGRISDGKFTLFDKNKFNSDFTLGANYHFIPKGSSYRYINNANADLIRKRIELKKQQVREGLTKQSFDKQCLEWLIRAETSINASDMTGPVVAQINKANFLEEEEFWKLITVNESENAAGLKLAASYFKNIENFTQLTTLLEAIATDTDNKISCDLAKLLDDYSTHRKKPKAPENDTLQYEIELAREAWISKSLWWLSFHGQVQYQKWVTYETSLTQLADLDTWGLGAKTYVNWYRLAEGYTLFARAGASLGRGTNLSDFKKREYLKMDTLETAGNSVYLEKKEGVAYFLNGDSVRFAPELRLDAEAYFVPFRGSMVAPGLYAKITMRHLFLAGKTPTLPMEIGLVFNVQSRKDDKNYLSILPFVGFDNLLKLDSDTQNGGVKNWKIGLKVGLPITMERRS